MNPALHAVAALLGAASLVACGEGGGGGGGDDVPTPVAIGAGTDGTSGERGGGGTGAILGTLGEGGRNDAPGQGMTPVPDGGASAPPVPGGDDSVAAIAGLYDFTFENEGGEDITYIEIEADGTFREYDFLGDAQASADGEFGNCYDIVEARIEPADDGMPAIRDLYRLEFRVTPDSPPIAVRVIVVRNGAGLLIAEFDEGERTFGTPVSGLSTTDFNACA